MGSPRGGRERPGGSERGPRAFAQGVASAPAHTRLLRATGWFSSSSSSSSWAAAAVAALALSSASSTWPWTSASSSRARFIL